MPLSFEFATASLIIFGSGSMAKAGPAARQLGSKALLVTGRHPERHALLLDALASQGISFGHIQVSGEPTVDDARKAAELGRKAGCDFVIGCGGGSVIDLAKASAALLTNHGDPLDYLEVVGRGQTFSKQPAPCMAIPTTSGTGSEVTRNAVLSSPEHGVKASLRHPGMLPALALVDPELCLAMPPELTASTGLDALTQLLEAFISIKANPLTDGFCRQGLPLAVRSLAKAFNDGSDLAAREDMSLASLLGGLALANAGLGVVHGFAGPVGGAFPIAHGTICAALLPQAMKANLAALRLRLPGSPALAKLEEFAHMAGCGSAEEGMAWLENLCRELEIPSLSGYGIQPGDFPSLVDKARQASSMKGNPVELTEGELRGILEEACCSACFAKALAEPWPDLEAR
ncbi:MAG: alcohol dehydrogenase [Spirochaetes bacterium RIFOXYC1_FULL_54_7]|nr:MAG: alcohol dehydrogenase [Spirochaetes bacterium RIFOXYC1_FULL_54_7]